MNLRAVFYSLGVCLVLALSIEACSPTPWNASEPTIRREMLDAYQAADELFTYVWTPEMFRNSRNEKKIEQLIDRLIVDFHNIEQRAPIEAFEPGFRIALTVQHNTLDDVRKRFSEGQKEYANWRLRGLSRNCIACHSRFNSPRNLLGSPPRVRDKSVDGRIAAAEFLVASRQFDAGSEELYELASDLLLTEGGLYEAFEALKLWLVVEVRVKNRGQYSAERLESLLESKYLPQEKAEVLRAWASDLGRLNRGAKDPDQATVIRARQLLVPVFREEAIPEKEKHLVSTLKASAYLHDILRTGLSIEEKRKASYLLAVAYDSMPIQSFDVFAPMYLEQCIREFPQTKEAQLSYQRLKTRTELDSTGSGGLHLDRGQQERLKKLRGSAYGARSSLLSDAINP